MNECGDCQVCCEVLKVKDFKKEKTKCKFQCATGCSVYKKRPFGCRNFNCAWLLSGWDKKYRPDISGIMVDVTKDEVRAFRVKDDIDMTLFNLLKDKNVKGYDAREIRPFDKDQKLK